MRLSKSKVNLILANVIWKFGHTFFKIGDFVGGYRLLCWQQKGWDKAGDFLMNLSAKYALRGYMIKKGHNDW